MNGFKAGHSTLKPVERDELGDVSGKTLLHLQCHFGLDTLSWAREGAFVTLEYLHEFSYSTYPFPWYLDEEQPDRYVWKDRAITVPLMFSIKATR